MRVGNIMGVKSAGLRALPSGQLDDVSWLDKTAQLVPNRDGNAAALVRHLAGANLMAIFRLRHSSYSGEIKCVGDRQQGAKLVTINDCVRREKPRPFKKQTSVMLLLSWRSREPSGYLPISKTMKTMFKFFEPGFTSFNKNTPSVAGLAILNVAGSATTALPVLPRQSYGNEKRCDGQIVLAPARS